MRRRSFLLNALGLAAVVGGGLWVKDNVLWRKPEPVFTAVPQWMPLEASGRPLPVIKATVAGKPVMALIDSGAQTSVIDSGLADALLAEGALTKTFDMPMVAYGVGGQAQVGRGVSVPVGFGMVSIDKLRAAILSLGPMATKEGLGVSLIIGRDILRELVLELDLNQSRARFLPKDGWVKSPQFLPVETAKVGDALAVEVSVEGAVIIAVLDTGASSVLSLTQALAKEAGLLDGRETDDGQSLVLGGVTSARWVRVSSLTVADMMKRNERVAVFADSSLPNYPDALLGIGAFAGQEMVLDLSRNALFLKGQMDITIGPDA